MLKHHPLTENIGRYLGRAYAVVISFFILFFFWLFTIRQNYACTILDISVLAIIAVAVRIWQERRRTTDPVGVTASRSDRLTPVLLFFITFAIRFQYCIFMDPHWEQVVDFWRVLYVAVHGGPDPTRASYYWLYPYKFFHGWALYHLGLRSQFQVLWLNCVYAGLIAALLYLIGKRIRDRRLGLIASVMYILWPAQTLYQVVTTEEHPAALIVAALAYLLIDIGKRIDALPDGSGIDRPILLRSVAAGVLFGLIPFFKDWGSVFLVALLLSSVWLFLRFHARQRIHLAILLLLVLVLRAGVHKGIDLMLGEVLDAKVSNTAVVSQMYGSLDPEFSTGTFGNDSILYAEYGQMLQDYGYDFDAANKEALSIILYKVTKDPVKTLELLYNKGVRANSATNQMIYWGFTRGAEGSFIAMFDTAVPILQQMEQSWYILMIVCIMLCALLYRDRYMVFILLLVNGGIAAQLLIEAQQRYKYSMESMWCLAAAGGLYALLYTGWSPIQELAVQIWKTGRRSSDSGGAASSVEEEIHDTVSDPDDRG